MSKYKVPFNSTTDLYAQAMLTAGLTGNVNITVASLDTSKEIYKVKKTGDWEKYRTGDDVVIFLNENIFDKLPEPQRILVVEESLASISYDSEHDKVIISKPDVITFSGILSKYTFETWNVMRESVKTLYTVEKNEKDAAAILAKKAKKQFR
jgi:hypothetical protein